MIYLLMYHAIQALHTCVRIVTYDRKVLQHMSKPTVCKAMCYSSPEGFHKGD